VGRYSLYFLIETVLKKRFILLGKLKNIINKFSFLNISSDDIIADEQLLNILS
jgi:hypothetical protein